MKPQLLVKIEREGYVEKLHYGFIWAIDEEYKVILKEGDDENTPFPFRSGAKPLQATAVIESGAYEEFGFNKEELAVICASHTGEDAHVEAVLSIINKTGLTENALKCVPHNLQNNCSGKHAGMLSVCVKNGWDIETYLDKKHPLQKLLMQKTQDLCLLKEIPPSVLDGCTAPVPVLPHYNMAVGYLNLLFNPKYTPIKQAMLEHPYIVGGKGRIDTEVMQASPGKFIAKVAAEGVCIIVNIEKRQALLVKITDASRTARSIAVWDALKKLGWID